jgi:LAO/AO transport system kinase
VNDLAENSWHSRARAAGASEILARLRAGGVRALARAISTCEDEGDGRAELLAACEAAAGTALRVGVTGPPGAGKSTLVNRLVRGFRARGKTVAVLAIDPSSPYSGGALLGDRIRMSGLAGDEGVYFRSMASRGATGGLAAAAAAACAVMEAAGFEVILIETVGAGQDSVEIAALARTTVVVLVPGMGDEVQSLKAGMMEIAAIFALNKADLDGVDRLQAEVLAMLGLGASSPERRTPHGLPPVIRTVATTGEGVDELIGQIENLPRRVAPGPGKAGEADGAVLRRSLRGAPALDHLGIAVRSIAAARGFYASLGLAFGDAETVAHEQVKTAMLPLGETRLELLEPTAEDSAVGRFLARRGEGLHHIALRLPGPDAATDVGIGIDGLFERLRADGVRLASDRVRTGSGGHRYFFIHPESAGGVLIEIVGDSGAGLAAELAPDPTREAAAE